MNGDKALAGVGGRLAICGAVLIGAGRLSDQAGVGGENIMCGLFGRAGTRHSIHRRFGIAIARAAVAHSTNKPGRLAIEAFMRSASLRYPKRHHTTPRDAFNNPL